MWRLFHTMRFFSRTRGGLRTAGIADENRQYGGRRSRAGSAANDIRNAFADFFMSEEWPLSWQYSRIWMWEIKLILVMNVFTTFAETGLPQLIY